MANPKAQLHFICGKAGAGKTTLARELGRTLPAIVFIEDEWFLSLGFINKSVEELRASIQKVRAVIGPLAIDLLKMGVSVVFDFAGNTPKHRQWARSIFEAAGADHVLHVIEASDEAALEGLHKRNREKPEGVFYGEVSDELFHAVTAHFVPPTAEENFRIQARKSFAQR
jgi:predicted kinase